MPDDLAAQGVPSGRHRAPDSLRSQFFQGAIHACTDVDYSRRMKTVQNGKGDRPRNNWGTKWYAGYAAIDWRETSRGLAPILRHKEDISLRNYRGRPNWKPASR